LAALQLLCARYPSVYSVAYDSIILASSIYHRDTQRSRVVT